jgi:hypothetical protein
MGMMLEGTKVARDENARKLDVTVLISQLAYEALMRGETSARDSEKQVRMENALQFYLADRGTDRPAWPYPGFLRGSETRTDVEITIEVQTKLWREFGEEADAQGVTVEQLAEHAAFYFAAEVDAGRVTERILTDLQREGPEPAGD